MSAWKKLPGEKGIYFRETARGGRSYMLRTSYAGQRRDEGLAGKTLAEVKEIQATLAANGERGVPPFFYSDWRLMAREQALAQAIRQETERKILIAEDQKRRNNTVAQGWENIYWPKRLRNLAEYSDKDSQTIAARWTKLLKPYFGAIPMQELHEDHFADFARKMRATVIPSRFHGDRPKRGLAAGPKYYSDSVINKCLGYMRRLWNVAKRNGLIEGAFPGERVIADIPENPHKLAYLELDEIKALLDIVYNRRGKDRTHHDVFCYATMALFLGLRAGEIHPLNLQTIERGIIEDTKNGESRFVNFNLEPVWIMLQERLHLYPVADAKALLFTTTAGTKYRGVPRRYTEIIAELGFNDIPRRKDNPRERIDFHALRHTYATHQLVSGGVLKESLQKLLGHKRPEMTMKYVSIAEHIQAKESTKILAAYGLPSKQQRTLPDSGKSGGRGLSNNQAEMDHQMQQAAL